MRSLVVCTFALLYSFSWGQSLQELLEGTQPDTGIVFTMGDVTFEADTTGIVNPDCYILLDSVLQLLEMYPEMRLEVRGHTNGGSPGGRINPEYSKYLSAKRAEAVVLHLKSRGIDGQRLQPKGYGASLPVATNLALEERKKNQRVDFKIIRY